MRTPDYERPGTRREQAAGNEGVKKNRENRRQAEEETGRTREHRRYRRQSNHEKERRVDVATSRENLHAHTETSKYTENNESVKPAGPEAVMFRTVFACL